MPSAPVASQFWWVRLVSDATTATSCSLRDDATAAGAAREEAASRAASLLARLLTPEEHDEFTKKGRVVVETTAGIFRLTEDGDVFCRRTKRSHEWLACVDLQNPDGGYADVPDLDEIASYYLAVKADPQTFLDECGVA